MRGDRLDAAGVFGAAASKSFGVRIRLALGACGLDHASLVKSLISIASEMATRIVCSPLPSSQSERRRPRLNFRTKNSGPLSLRQYGKHPTLNKRSPALQASGYP